MRMRGSVLGVGLALAVAGCGGLTPVLRGLGSPGGPTRGLAGDPPAPVEIDARAAHAHAAYLSLPEWRGRDSASPGDEEATRYAEAHFKALGFATGRQDFTHWSFKGTARNLIAVVPGRSADRFVVVGAHKDHIGVGWSGKVYPGANDDAGGCAGVLEIGTALKSRIERGETPDATVLLMLFSGEEKGLIGSAYYVANPVVPQADGTLRPVSIKQVAGMVQLDVIANGQPDRFSTDMAGSEDPQIRADVLRLARRHGMTTTFRPFTEHRPQHAAARELPPGASSDHASFRRAGVRAVLFYAEPIHRYLHHPADTVQERDTFQKDADNVFNDEKLAKLAQLGMEQVLAWGKP